MADTRSQEFDDSFNKLVAIMDLCRDELKLRKLRRSAHTWQAKVTYLTLEDTIRSWRLEINQ